MSDNYATSYELVNALKYSNLKDGEVIFKINGKVWIGSISELDVSLKASEIPAFVVSGFLKQ